MKTILLLQEDTKDSNSKEENIRKGKEKEKENRTAAVSDHTKDIQKEMEKEKGKEKENNFSAKMDSGMNQHLHQRQQLILARVVNEKVKPKESSRVTQMAKAPKGPMPTKPQIHPHHLRQQIKLLINNGTPLLGIGVNNMETMVGKTTKRL